jgi:hypothetical protein
MWCEGKQEQILYVILPYFNFCGFKRRRDLFIKFVEEMRLVKGIRIIISEVIGPAPLPSMKGPMKHLTFETKSRIWLKENLINMAIRHFPATWKYVAWVDADVTFMNPTWVRDTLDELDQYSIVQMFQTAANLGPKGEVFKVDKSFGYMYRGSGTPYTKNDRYGFWHPGYAWACTRNAWEQMGGLLDWAILGSGDRHMALALIGRVLDSAPGNIHENYRTMLREFQHACKGLTLSYVPGTILHHWHGSLENRRYRERWDILTQNKFNPLVDIGERGDNGLIQLTTSGQRMVTDLDNYFIGRKEDN